MGVGITAVRYGIADTVVGRVLVAATDRGVCGLSLGDTDADLEAWLREEFPGVPLTRSDKALSRWLAAVAAQVAGKPSADVPLDAHGTPFQLRVWAELRAIPRGETRTYTQVAAALGKPTAVRAVARACATNPVSILTPCHRVVGAAGDLRGYRWGIERKRRLLETEQRTGVRAK